MSLKVNILIVAFIIVVSHIDVFAYRIIVNDKPIISERFSIDKNNESIVSREVINRVHHQHEQNIGNVHVLTNINIENVITVRNVSDPSKSSDTTPGLSKVDSKQNAAVDGHKQFRRLDRNLGVNLIKFPVSSEQSRHIQWPSGKHSTHAIDSQPFDSQPVGSVIIFPRSDMRENNLENVVPLSAVPAATNVIQSNQIADLLQPNAVNFSVYMNIQMAIEQGLEPLAYIDDDGLFQVKYVPKAENVSDDNKPANNLNEQSLTSINVANGAIISNDNRKIPQDSHYITTEKSNTNDTIDETISNNNEVHSTKNTSPKQLKPIQPEQSQQQSSSDDDRLIFSA